MKQFLLIAYSLIACLFFSCNRQSPIEIKKMKINDIEIAYYIRGNGEPLVMIMGFRGTMSMWDPALLEHLEKKYKVILFDNRGAGLSTDTEKDLTTISQMAEDTASFIKALGYQKVHVLGWSMGSRIAMELAVKNPDIIDHLILCSPNPGGEHQAKRTTNSYEKLTAKELSKQEALSLIFPETEEGYKAAEAYIERITKAIIEKQVPYDIEVSTQTVERQVKALKEWDKSNQIYDLLPKIKIPTLAAGGLSDVLDNPENVQMVACRIPFAWSAFFPGAGHNFHSQEYMRFSDLVILFLEHN